MRPVTAFWPRRPVTAFWPRRPVTAFWPRRPATAFWPRRPVTALAAAVITLALVAGACGGPRNSLNTASSVCFRALAVAQDTVRHKGRLVGVRKVRADSLARHLPTATTEAKGDECLVAFQGAYHDGDVVGAPGAGRYALVAVTTGQPVVLGARVTDDLPIRFHHRT